MSNAPYTNQGRAIAAADVGTIRERWLWGVRLLHDADKLSAGGGGLKHGAIADLLASAKAAGLKLSEQEIQRRLRCARAYPTESQIRISTTDFATWTDLVRAGFPAVEAVPGEPPADYRTASERKRDRNRDLADRGSGQLTLFPLDMFEPVESTLKELGEYVDQQEELTSRFVAHGHKRRAYYDAMVAAVDNDLSVTWAAAHAAAFGDDSDPAGDVA
jgi:hypothetical protein